MIFETARALQYSELKTKLNNPPEGYRVRDVLPSDPGYIIVYIKIEAEAAIAPTPTPPHVKTTRSAKV